MKFIPIDKARNLEIGKPVITLNESGGHWLGRLVTKTERVSVKEFTFELARFVDSENPPALEPEYVNNITHVAIIKT